VLVDCDDPLTVHKCCSTWPAFEFQARPVIAVEDAVRVELEAIAWRDGLNASDSGHRLQLRPECGSSASIDVVISALTLHHLEPAAADVRVHRYPQLARQCAVRAKRRRA
jgi:hypothetical protein